jgi:hypothetical protein
VTNCRARGAAHFELGDEVIDAFDVRVDRSPIVAPHCERERDIAKLRGNMVPKLTRAEVSAPF